MRTKRREGRKARILVLPADGSCPWRTRRVVRPLRGWFGVVRLEKQDFVAKRRVDGKQWTVRDGPREPIRARQVFERRENDRVAEDVFGRIDSGFREDVLLGGSTHPFIVLERHRIWKEMARVGTPVAAIARLFGRHHTTVLAALGRLGVRR